MGFVRQLLATRAAGHPSQHSLAAIFGMGPTSYTGVAVTEDSALTYSAVFAAIRLLAWSTAMLPLLVYRRQDRGKTRAADHPLYPLLKEEANPEMTAFDFRSTIMSHAVGRGNGYAEIEWSKAGVPLALWPLNPAKTRPQRVNGELRYLVDLPDGTTANLPSWRVHHIRGLSGNGVVGYSPIRLAMQAIGLGLATEEFGSRFFGNGARPGLILKHPGVLSEDGFNRLRNSWNGDHQGLSQSHRVKILEEGMDIQTVGVPPEEAQFLETRKFQVTEIARWFNVPPHMIADMSGATFSNIEEQGVEFVTYSLGPWLINVEQGLTRDLLTPSEKRVLLIEHLVDGLLRGRTAERYAAYQTALQGGWMSPNEVRERENMNPYDGGDTYLLPMNMTPASTDSGGGNGLRSLDRPDARRVVSRETTPPQLSTARVGSRRALAEERQQLFEAYVPLYQDVADRMVRREVQDVGRALDKYLRRRNTNDFFTWLTDYYADYQRVLREAFFPVMLSLAQLVARMVATELGDNAVTQDEITEFVEEYLDGFAQGATASGEGQLRAVAAQAQIQAQEEGGSIEDYVVEKIKERLEEWAEKKAVKIAKNQAFRAGNGLIVTNYTIKGVRSIEWLANSGACAFCQKLDGKIVSIEEYFVAAGETLTGGAGDAPMISRSKKKHGPLHQDCSCTVRASERSSTATAPAPSNPYGPKQPKEVVGDSAGANAARQLRELDPWPARAEYLVARDRVDLKLYQADLIRKDIRQAEAGIFPYFVGNDAAAQAAYKARLAAELDRAVQEHIEVLNALDVAKAAQDRAYERAAAETKKLLGGGNYYYFPELGDKLQRGSTERAAYDEAEAWLAEFVTSKRVGKNIVRFAIDVDEGLDRSYYLHSDERVVMAPRSPAAIYLHEIAHAIDRQNDKINAAALDFWKRRTAGLAEEALSKYGSGYRADERCIPDEFMSPYCGRLPTTGGGTEIISMGMQFMFEDPLRFATEDPEYFTLIYDLFRTK